MTNFGASGRTGTQSGTCRSRSTSIATSGTASSCFGHLRAHGKGSGIDLDVPVAYLGSENQGGLIRKLRAFLNPEEALEAVGLSEQDAHPDS
jgi:hypothetical protein